MAQTINQRRKEVLESCDFHLFTAIDRAFAIWVDITPQHPELAYHLERLMHEAELCRFHARQFFQECWGGNPAWLLKHSEIASRLREVRRERALEKMRCREFVPVLVDLQTE